MVLSFLVDKQIITRVDKEKVVRDSMNYLYANFEFSPDWTGQKTAVFKSKSGAFNVLLDDDGKCLVPWEVLQDEVIEISVFCGALITANVVKIITLASGYTIGEEGREPTPDVYTQIMEKLSEIEAEVDPEALQALIDAYLADKDYVTEADVETIVAAYVNEHKSEWQGSEVSVTQTLQSGTKIAEISVDGTTTNLYAPNGGGGATALDDLTDVSLTTPQSGDVLVYDGGKWGNKGLETGINIIAHRGLYSESIPQNTIPAFINAFNNGFRWLELDIMRTADDKWVLSHDTTVTLYKNGVSETVTIANKTYSELQEYTWDVNGQYKIDSFAKCLYDLKKYNMTIVIDIKGEKSTVDVCSIVADYGMQNRCYVTTTAAYITAHAEELEKYKDIAFRLWPDNYTTLKQAIALVDNPIVLDINTGRWNDLLPIALALRLPIICADFTSKNIPENRKGVINVISGVMDSANVTFDELRDSTIIPVDYSEITITESDGVCASSGQAATLHAQNNVANGGFINLYTENPEIASLVQNTRGTNVNATITAVSDGVTIAKVLNGSFVNEIPVNVSMNGYFGLLGDVKDNTMVYSFNNNKITLFAGVGDANCDLNVVKARRFEYSRIGYYGKTFYITEIPSGATKLHATIDTTKVAAKVYIKTYSAEKTRLQAYSWQADREIDLSPNEKYFTVTARYDDSRALQSSSAVNADFENLLAALSVEFT